MGKNVEEAQAALASAEAALVSEMKRDIDRPDGSGAQERRRQEHQDKLREAVYRCKKDLEEAKNRQA